MDATRIEKCFLRLVKAALNGEKPEALPADIPLEQLMQIARRQQMTPLLFSALNSLQTPPEGEVWETCRKDFLSDCARSEIQTAAYRKLARALCAQGVRLLPLKGCALKEIYPSPYLRVMSDLDLLYEGVNTDRMTELMTSLGYTAEAVGRGHHDVYHQYPVLNVEMHRQLFLDNSPYKAALEDIFTNALPDPEVPGLFHARSEDLYIHQIAHAAKHFVSGGMGVRGIADVYVLNRTYGVQWDRDALDARLAAVGLERFEKKVRGIAEAFFGDGDEANSEVSEEDFAFLFDGGVYGRSGYSWRYLTRGGSATRAGYILDAIFPPASRLSTRYPVLERAPGLLPAMWVAKWTDVLVHRGWRVKRVLRDAEEVDPERMAYAERILKSFGLDRP